MRDRLPFMKTAARPFLGPAVNHIATDLPLTVNDSAAPVDVVAHTDFPCATRTFICVHGDEELYARAGAGDTTATTSSAHNIFTNRGRNIMPHRTFWV